MLIPPPFDREIEQALIASGELSAARVTRATVAEHRARQQLPPVDTIISGAGMSRTDVLVPTYDNRSIEMSVVRARNMTEGGPLIVFVHGGGMIMGHRWGWLNHFVEWSERYGAAIATIDYRLAPEHPDPTPVEDVYAGLGFASAHASMWGADPARLMIVGVSAGGGLAAGATLMARDRGGPAIGSQLLAYPMLDDRDQTVSSAQIDGIGRWDRAKNAIGWDALLGPRRGTDDVSIYAAPARATDLASLPPTYIECGSAEVFRDENVAYASGIWAAGGDAELHVWPGGVHGFDSFAPAARLSRDALEARRRWLDRQLLGPTPDLT